MTFAENTQVFLLLLIVPTVRAKTFLFTSVNVSAAVLGG